jgi:hypothetical protein
MADIRSWDQEDAWWSDNFASRPYATGRNYEDFRPGYRYGFESGLHHMGRAWSDVESDLRTGWERYEFRGRSAWENVKDAVRDAWHRVTGQKDVDVDKMAESGRRSRNL